MFPTASQQQILTDRRHREQAEIGIVEHEIDAEPPVRDEEAVRLYLKRRLADTIRTVSVGMTPAQRARVAYNLGVRPRWISGARLSVMSLTSDRDHVVTINADGSFTCDCMAGQHGYSRCLHVVLCEIEEEVQNRPYETLS